MGSQIGSKYQQNLIGSAGYNCAVQGSLAGSINLTVHKHQSHVLRHRIFPQDSELGFQASESFSQARESCSQASESCWQASLRPQNHVLKPQDHVVRPQNHVLRRQNHILRPKNGVLKPQNHVLRFKPRNHTLKPQRAKKQRCRLGNLCCLDTTRGYKIGTTFAPNWYELMKLVQQLHKSVCNS